MILKMNDGRQIRIVRDTPTPAVEKKDLWFRVVGTPAEKLAPVEGHRIDSTLSADKKAAGFDIIRDEAGRIIDYQGLTIKGYASSWNEDRDGERMVRGAFKDSIGRFLKKNPVMLADHLGQVRQVVGRWTKVVEDDFGLYVEGEVANGDSEMLRHTRAVVAQGALRTLSVGGQFWFDRDGVSITRVELFEISLVGIPANQDAVFSVARI